MGVTVTANGLSIVHRGSNGLSAATLPDVCKTPPDGKPIPYSNTSYSKDVANGTTTVFADGGNMCAHAPSEHATSVGDEAGSMGGISSGTFMKESTWITYSFDVKFEGEGVCRFTDKKFQNHRNTVDMAGHSGANLSDPLLQLLCDIFCEVREKGKGKKGFRYSDEARKLVKESRYANRFGSVLKAGQTAWSEKSFLVAMEKGAVQGRKIYSFEAIKARLKRQARSGAWSKFIGSGAGKVATKVGTKVGTKFIPFVGWGLAAYDVYDLASTANELFKQAMSNYDTHMIRPDIGVLNEDGSMADIYDFKFDDPESGYQDDFSDDQKKLYKQATGKDPKEINQALCKCD